MARLIFDSSDPGAVDRDKALWLLSERVVLTSAVCHELMRREDFGGRRSRAALDHLRRWVGEHYDAKGGVTGARDGLEAMTVPDGAEDLMEELWAGVAVCEALAMMYTADTFSELASDKERIAATLRAFIELTVPAQGIG